MVVNERPAATLEQYKEKAKGTGPSRVPAQIGGGVFISGNQTGGGAQASGTATVVTPPGATGGSGGSGSGNGGYGSGSGGYGSGGYGNGNAGNGNAGGAGASGTGATGPGQTSVPFNPFEGAASRGSVSVGFVAVVVAGLGWLAL